MEKLELNIISTNKHLFVLIFTLLAILTMFINLHILDLLGVEYEERPVEDKTFWFIVGAIIIAPLIETFLFQKLPIDYFRKYIKNDWPLVIISAVPFGLIHYIKDFFVRDIFYAFCFGAIFAYAYVLAGKREDMNAYWAVVIIHAGYNTVALI